MPEPKHALEKYFDGDAVAQLTAIGYKPMHLVEGHLVGDHRSPFHGFAVEFAGHRQYVPGDPPKHVDWNVYFRSGKLLIKQYAQETNLVAHLFVDVSETMQFEYKGRSKRDYAAFVAVAIAGAIQAQKDKVSVHFFADSILAEESATGSREVIGKISNYMEKSELKGDTAIGRILSMAAEDLGRRKAVFIVSDFFNDVESMFDGMKRLLYNHNEVILLHVLDPLELDFNHEGPIELVELEGEGRRLVNGRSLREGYNKAFGAYREEMETSCRKLGIDYVLCNTGESFGLTLAKYMNTRIARISG